MAKEGVRVDRVVVAGSEATAWREAVAQSTEDLRALAVWSSDSPLLWAVDAVEPTDLTAPPDPSFRFHGHWEEFRGGPLAYLAVLIAHLGLRTEVGTTHVATYPETPLQYRVEMRAELDEWTVVAAGWHLHFADPHEAVACFRWLMTPYARVVRESQSGEETAAWVERYGPEGWASQDQVFYRNPTDPTRWMGGGWRRETWQQDLLRPPEDALPEGSLGESGLPPDSVIGLCVGHPTRSFAEERGWMEGDYNPRF